MTIEQKLLSLGWNIDSSDGEYTLLKEENNIDGEFVSYVYTRDNRIHCNINARSYITAPIFSAEKVEETIDFMKKMIELGYDCRELGKLEDFVRQYAKKVNWSRWNLEINELRPDLKLRITINAMSSAVVTLYQEEEGDEKIQMIARIVSLKQLREFIKASIFLNGSLKTVKI